MVSWQRHRRLARRYSAKANQRASCKRSPSDCACAGDSNWRRLCKPPGAPKLVSSEGHGHPGKCLSVGVILGWGMHRVADPGFGPPLDWGSRGRVCLWFAPAPAAPGLDRAALALTLCWTVPEGNLLLGLRDSPAGKEGLWALPCSKPTQFYRSIDPQHLLRSLRRPGVPTPLEHRIKMMPPREKT